MKWPKNPHEFLVRLFVVVHLVLVIVAMIVFEIKGIIDLFGR